MQLLIYVLHTYILNNSLDVETISKMVLTLQENLSESELRSLGESRIANLARSLKIITGSRGMPQFKEYEQTVTKIYLDKQKMRVDRNKAKGQQQQGNDEDEASFESSPEDGHLVSKENLFVRDTLQEMGKEFKEETLLEDALFKCDFYLPKSKLVIEINGKSHFYPYTTRFNNFSNLKMKSLYHEGYNVMNLNSWTLEGFIRNDNRAGLKDLLSKTVTTFETNPNLTKERQAARKAAQRGE
jgi:very-short-patch-repair endonuclease